MYRMHNAISVLGLVVCVAAAGHATEKEVAGAESSTNVFVVELTEVVLQDAEDITVSGLSQAADLQAEFRKLEPAGKIKVFERIAVTVIENEEILAQFGRRVPVVTGTSVTGSGRQVQQTHYENVGTLVRIEARREGNDVVLRLVFESSRHEPPAQPDGPVSVATTTVNTTLQMKVGETALACSSHSNDRSLIAVFVSLPERGSSQPARSAAESRDVANRTDLPGQAPPTSAESKVEDRVGTYVRALIQRFDANGDGYLDTDEVTGLPMIGREFGRLDADGDARASQEELKVFFRRPPQP